MKLVRGCLGTVCLAVLLCLCLGAGAETLSGEEELIGRVAISELAASVSPFRADRGCDWAELYNASSARVKLKGWRLTLGKKEYVFSSGTLGKGEYLRVDFAKEPSGKTPCTGFPLPREGGTLCLFDPEGALVSRVSWRDLPGNVSFGLIGEEYGLLEGMTPGKKNTGRAYGARTEAPELMPEGSVCAGETEVSIRAAEGAIVYYTLDGSVPSEKSAVYTGPFTVTENTVVRAAAKRENELLSEAVSASYLFGIPEGVTAVSVLCDDEYLYSAKNGLLVSGSGSVKNYEKDWEYPAHVEYFEPGEGLVLSQDCGVKVAGAISRRRTQKSLVFFARKAYGNGIFPFGPFPHREEESVKCFVLRNGGSEGLADGTRFRDALLTSLALDSACLVSDAKPVLVYLNGRLYGHCNIRERVNKYFIGVREGVPETELDRIDILTENGTVSQGSSADYKALSKYCKTHDLNDPEALSYVLDRLDADSLFDCMAFQAICGNADMHNLRFYRVPGGKWKWMLYDFDTAMRGMNVQPIADLAKGVKDSVLEKWDHVPFAALMKVPAMRDRFFTRVGELLRTVFTPERIREETARWEAEMASIIAVHCTRWTSLTPESWHNNVRTRLEIMLERPGIIPSLLQRYFRLTKEEMLRYFGT